MPRPTTSLQQFARIGALARLKALGTEIDAILQLFPDLKASDALPFAWRVGGAPGAGVAAPGPVPAAAPRKRSKMSAAQKRAVSERMTRYWAGRRAAEAQAESPKLESPKAKRPTTTGKRKAKGRAKGKSKA